MNRTDPIASCKASETDTWATPSVRIRELHRFNTISTTPPFQEIATTLTSLQNIIIHINTIRINPNAHDMRRLLNKIEY